MLKALELNGFKSFADRTRMEFPPGITVVVGPNGSGKSNIVDAMKWVLGEQSARSLRGKEMADVIFKGSGGTGRRPANSAEVTIIFDNSERLLPIDAPEVHVTRRVYRSGEGEYLINGEVCRLRDIKDMFRGTGVGTDAYSIIEQGKVDMLLQASPKDRRAIFEEAAGISRFKAKKVEAQRRLERVDQNLLRLNDIVEEVEGRLRRLKSQATKAQRYREYTQRLQELRTQVGRVDWQRLSQKLVLVEDDLLQLQEERDSYQSHLDALEARRLELDTHLSILEEDLRGFESRAGRTRESIAGYQATLRHARQQASELEEEVSRFQRRLLAMHQRAGTMHAQLRETLHAEQNASADHQACLEKLLEIEATFEGLTQQWNVKRAESETLRRQLTDQMRRRAEFSSRRSSYQAAIDTGQANQVRLREAIEELDVSIARQSSSVALLSQKREELELESGSRDKQLQELRAELTTKRSAHAALTEESIQLRQRLAAARERSTLLQEIEQRLEDVGAGVKDVLYFAQLPDPGPFAGVRGMVADLLRVVDPHVAPLIEAALGDRAQHVVVAGSKLIEYLQQERHELSGRVGIVRLESSPPPSPAHQVDLTGHTGVLGRADRWLETAPEYRHLVRWMLGTTWLVRNLADAVELRRSLDLPLRFVTQRGEIVEADGRLMIGPDRGRVGLISRRAELQTLQIEVTAIEQRIYEIAGQVDALQMAIRERESRAVELAEVYEQVSRDFAEAKLHERTVQDQINQFAQQREKLEQELQVAVAGTSEQEEKLADAIAQQHQCDEAIVTLESQVAMQVQAAADLERERQDFELTVTAARVEKAKSEQRFDALHTQLEQLQREHSERERAIGETRGELQRRESQWRQSCSQALQATSELALLYLHDQQNSSEGRRFVTLRANHRQEREGLNQELNGTNRRMQKLQEKWHARELEGERIRHERTTLAERLKEDYGIEVADLETELTEEEKAVRDEVDQEIADLRRKISNIGSVNMDALSELEDLEQRYSTLSTQFQDLKDAKESLERIIQKINADSRRLFAETLDIIRANFKVLFRKVFGGGSADIVLEDGVDMLESGIDIVATPPGKQSLALSLLSGGERALTAVTLLMAIFEYRPSPFCVLDEVDGPLDEANIGRFVDVLNEFLKWTKFVVVTHSKKTMTAAHTLYGVTMQESGVSKRVSVRFEDVSENGEISQEAIERDGRTVPSGDDERGAA
jgi:chromosome segregation protein